MKNEQIRPEDMHGTIENPQAFPVDYATSRGVDDGMTLRDYFAAKAIQGMTANLELCHEDFEDIDASAKQAYEFADAMLKARIKTESGDAQRNEVGDRK